MIPGESFPEKAKKLGQGNNTPFKVLMQKRQQSAAFFMFKSYYITKPVKTA
jgi:hypothetical protein